jgi:hypothetical protein
VYHDLERFLRRGRNAERQGREGPTQVWLPSRVIATEGERLFVYFTFYSNPSLLATLHHVSSMNTLYIKDLTIHLLISFGPSIMAALSKPVYEDNPECIVGLQGKIAIYDDEQTFALRVRDLTVKIDTDQDINFDDDFVAKLTRTKQTSYDRGFEHSLYSLEQALPMLAQQLSAKSPETKIPDGGRTYLHEDEELCQELLKTISTKFDLEIRPSTIKGAGSGLFTKVDIPAFVEIYRSDPFLVVPKASAHQKICNYCYRQCIMSSSCCPSEACLHGNAIPGLVQLTSCPTCFTTSYCSKVRRD